MQKTVIAAIAAALVLAACGPGDPGASPTPSASATPSPPASASPTPSPSPSPSPSPTPTGPPPLADLEITTQGLLPLTIGEDAETNPGAAMITYDDDHCYSEEFGMTTGDLGRWLSTYGASGGEGFSLAVDDGELWRIDVWDPAIATPEGIHIGSTLGELMDVYPTELESGTGYAPTSAVWWIEDSHGIVVFESQNPTDWEADPDIEDEIILIRVLSADSDPDWSAANSGNVAGTCL